MVREWRVTITGEDLEFLRLAKKHYRVFAEGADRQGEDQVAGTCRTMEFRAEQFLNRVEASLKFGERDK